MKEWLKGVLSVGLALLFAAAAPSLAWSQSSTPQLQPPVMNTADANGVDLVSGALLLSDMTISVGDADTGGLSWSFLGMGSRDTLVGELKTSSAYQNGVLVTTYRVNLGGSAAIFEQTSGSSSIVRKSGAGKSLEYDATTSGYKFTALDGSVARFNTRGALDTLIRPSGERTTYTYTLVDAACTSSCAYKLQAVTNNLGYMIKYQYQPGTAGLAKVVAINLAQEYCSPIAETCSLTSPWMSATFSAPPTTPSSSFTISDNLGRSATYATNSYNQITSITRPGGAGPIAINYYPSTDSAVRAFRISSIVTPAGTWNYNYVVEASYGYFGTWFAQIIGGTSTDPTNKTYTVSILYPYELIISSKQGDRPKVFYNYTGSDLSGVRSPEGNAVSYVRVAPNGPVSSVSVTDKTANAASSKVMASAGYSYDTSVANCSNPLMCDKPLWTRDATNAQTDYTYYSDTHGSLKTALSPAPDPGAAVGPGNFRQLTTLQYTAYQAVYKNASGALVADPNAVYRLTNMVTCDAYDATGCADAASKRRVSSYVYGAADGSRTLPLQLISASQQAGDGTLTSTVNYTYNIYGDVRTVSDPVTGQTSRNRYDALRRSVGEVALAPGDGRPPRATRFVYAPSAQDKGQPVRIDTGTVVDQSDAAWSNFSVSASIVRTSDALGRVVREDGWDKNGATIAVSQYDYDGANRLTYMTQRMNPSVFGALPALAATASTPGAAGPDRISRRDHNSYGEVSAVTRGVGVLDAAASSTYSPNGKLKTVTDEEGHQTTYDYDAYDRLQKVTYPTVGAQTLFETYTYDAADRLATWLLRDGQSLSFCYDALSRIKQRVPQSTATPCSATPDVAFTYDGFGQVRTASRAGLTVTNDYDALGRLSSQVQPLGAVSYQYDAASRRTRLTWPDAVFQAYEYYDDGALKAVKRNSGSSGADLIAQFSYDALGRRTGVARGNSVSTTYSYDDASRLDSLVQNPAGSADDVTFGFFYSPSGQLIQRKASNDAYAWVGSFESQRAYTPNALNQIAVVAGVTLQYDNRGNLIEDRANPPASPKAYAYDIDNNLVGAAAGASMGYDPMGRLYQSMTAGGTVTRYLYDGAEIIGEYSGSNALLRRYARGDSMDEPLISYNAAGVPTWLLSDQLGSVVAMTDSTGAVTSKNSYDDYGFPRSGNQGLFQYTGQAWLADFSLYHYKARAYSPGLGRFLQADPIGYADGLNSYAYVGNDPVNSLDPTGTSGECGGVVFDYGIGVGGGPAKCSDRQLDALWDSYIKSLMSYSRNVGDKLNSFAFPEHDYTQTSDVCRAGSMSNADMARQLSRYAVPGRSHDTPVRNGDRNIARDGIAIGGVVDSYVSANGLSVTNVTGWAHIFCCGQIERSAYVSSGRWKVTTHGTGWNVGPVLAYLNQKNGPKIFDKLDKNMRADARGRYGC